MMDCPSILDPATDLAHRYPQHKDLPTKLGKPNKHHQMRKPKAMKLYAADRTSTLNTSRVIEQDKDDELSLILLEGINKKSSREVVNELDRLADICSQCEYLCREACHMGAPATVVTVMRKWSSNKDIQANCFRVFIALTFGPDSTKSQKALWMVGGMEAVIKAMTRFPESRSLQLFGCSAILSLLPCGIGAVDSKKLVKWMGRRFVSEMQGVKVVISAMIQFEEDRPLQETGCSVLLKLATFMYEGKDRKMLLESGAVSAFSVALESHPNNEDIQDYTTMFMNFLSDA